jgi:hypothetical protein
MIPDFEPDGTLPVGMHWAQWIEVKERFGFNAHRRGLLHGLKQAIDVLQIAGCHTIYLDGSFVTAKPLPNDFDVCWDWAGVNADMLDAELLDESPGWRERQKARYGGEFFPVHSQSVNKRGSMVSFFRTNKETGTKKGIIALDLRALP